MECFLLASADAETLAETQEGCLYEATINHIAHENPKKEEEKHLVFCHGASCADKLRKMILNNQKQRQHDFMMKQAGDKILFKEPNEKESKIHALLTIRNNFIDVINQYYMNGITIKSLLPSIGCNDEKLSYRLAVETKDISRMQLFPENLCKLSCIWSVELLDICYTSIPLKITLTLKKPLGKCFSLNHVTLVNFVRTTIGNTIDKKQQSSKSSNNYKTYVYVTGCFPNFLQEEKDVKRIEFELQVIIMTVFKPTVQKNGVDKLPTFGELETTDLFIETKKQLTNTCKDITRKLDGLTDNVSTTDFDISIKCKGASDVSFLIHQETQDEQQHTNIYFNCNKINKGALVFINKQDVYNYYMQNDPSNSEIATLSQSMNNSSDKFENLAVAYVYNASAKDDVVVETYVQRKTMNIAIDRIIYKLKDVAPKLSFTSMLC